MPGFDGFAGAGEGRVEEGYVKDFEEEVEDWYAYCCLEGGGVSSETTEDE